MMDDEEFRRSLQGAAPDAPDMTGWARTARRRSVLRRGTAVVASLGVLALAGSLVVANQSGDVGSRVAATPATTPPPSGTAEPTSTEEVCYADADTADSPRQVAMGAVAVQLCADADNPDATFLAPNDLLTTGVDALAKRVNAAAPKPLGKSCDGGYVRTFLIVFVYADGSRIPLRARSSSDAVDALGEPGPCSRIDGPDGWRDGSVLTAIRSAWQAQRDDSPAPAPVVASSCPEWPAPLFPADLKTVSAGVLCVDGASRALTTEQARDLAADIRAHERYVPNDDQHPTATLTLYTPWGEWLSMSREGDTNRWGGGNGDGNWLPSAKVREWLYPLIDGLAVPETPEQTGRSERIASLCPETAPTGDAIPTDAVTLRLCPYGDANLQQLVPEDALDSDGAHEVLALLQAQPALDTSRGCDADLGPSFLLVASYFGREPVVMEVQVYGCGSVGTTTDRRTGAQAVLDAFSSALTTQRQRQPLPQPDVTCDRDEMRQSFMPIGPADVAAAVACSYADESSYQRWPDAAQLAAITADLAAHGGPPTDACPATTTLRLPPTLVLANRWDDRLVLSTAPCADAYTYRIDGHERRWRPTDSVRTILESLHG
jgi:hypothetical protein